MLQLMAGQAARNLWKPRARHLAQVVLPEPLALLAPLLLPVACSDKVAVAVVAVLLALVARAVLEAVAQAAVVARVAAAHTRPALVA